MNARFTLDGSAALEAQLTEICQALVEEMQRILGPSLQGILLGGGYGRGEGGVLQTPAGDRPYNDLESYLFVDGSALLAERRHQHALHAAAERLTAQAGIEVEFKLVNRRKLRRSGTTMFFYDLARGHRRLFGPATLLAGAEHQLDASAIPLHEVTRLLMNRCSGLLLAEERLARPEFGAAEADFALRNVAKAELALGDVVLAAHGEYHFSCRERHARLQAFRGQGVPRLAEIVSCHADGVEFKLHPRQASADERGLICARLTSVSELARELWLWLEQRRLGVPFASVRDYTLSPLNKCPETHGLRNRLVNARAFGLRFGFGAEGRGHPCERLLATLPVLLWEPALLADPAAHGLCTRRLDLPPTADLASVTAAYERLWVRFR